MVDSAESGEETLHELVDELAFAKENATAEDAMKKVNQIRGALDAVEDSLATAEETQ